MDYRVKPQNERTQKGCLSTCTAASSVSFHQFTGKRETPAIDSLPLGHSRRNVLALALMSISLATMLTVISALRHEFIAIHSRPSPMPSAHLREHVACVMQLQYVKNLIDPKKFEAVMDYLEYIRSRREGILKELETPSHSPL